MLQLPTLQPVASAASILDTPPRTASVAAGSPLLRALVVGRCAGWAPAGMPPPSSAPGARRTRRPLLRLCLPRRHQQAGHTPPPSIRTLRPVIHRSSLRVDLGRSVSTVARFPLHFGSLPSLRPQSADGRTPAANCLDQDAAAILGGDLGRSISTLVRAFDPMLLDLVESRCRENGLLCHISI